MTPQTILLHLSLIDNIGPACIAAIMRSFADPAELVQLYTMSPAGIQNRCGLTEQKALLVREGLKNVRMLQQELALIERHGMHVVTVLDDHYPALLRSIHMPPIVLYYQGTLPTESDLALAVVGSRKASMYGLDVLRTLVPALVYEGVTIVSGGALGIDQYAHEQTIKAGGKTVAVLCSVLLRPYPLSNRRLFASIIEHGGAIVSPFPLEMSAMAGNFPARNRIIAGLSTGCLVVQAAQKSGALITAQFALEQGREVCAVPGPIDAPLSQGCHALIKDGATLVTGVQDIMQLLGVHRTAAVASSALAAIVPNKGAADELWQLCDRPMSIEDLVEKTGYSLEDIHARLFTLQIEGLLEQDFMGFWQRV